MRLHDIETRVIQEPNCLKILGSFPRVDMRIKKIKTFGFIGSGDMSRWFSDKLEARDMIQLSPVGLQRVETGGNDRTG